jgi:hypothetical protein
LRDSAIGPAPCGPAALVRLRAVQAALFVRAIVLTWQPGALGPQPASRLPGNLTPEVAGAWQMAVHTDADAATALSVHLNQGPAFFGMLQLSDVAPDGSAIRGSAGRPCPVQRGPASWWKAEASGLLGQVREQEQRAGMSSRRPNRSAFRPMSGRCSPRIWPTGAPAAPPTPTLTSCTLATRAVP